MPVTYSADAQVFDMHNARFTSLIRPSVGSKELNVWTVEVQPGSTGVPHRIHREEAFVVLEGSVVITIDGESATLVPGDAAVANADSRIGLDNPGDQPAKVLVTTSVGFTGELADGTIVNPPWVN
ncbi:cupin domain-containing protein [Nocardia crassostreae]|uniref:cupin domain-containing protein n=1 Tax=Nocardia crassostreae TaxID=53428 RepID=UPI00082A7C23|nr:cupin domain-containing protein [Nocardia crassostreae]